MTLDLVWACPYCHDTVRDARCGSCGVEFSTSGGQLDFRPTKPIALAIHWRYDPEFGAFPWDRVRLDWPSHENGVDPGPGCEVVERNMLHSVPRGAGLALDIGCGERRQRFKTGLASLGYTPVGIDLGGPAPDALADAHVLPLRDRSVDLVMSSAVWEHLKNPHRAMAEVARVIKPGALFVGSVAFSEPFYISYFHHSPLAVYELLDANGFEVDSIILVDRYSAFRAHLGMGYAGARIPRPVRDRIADLFWYAAVAPGALRGRGAEARLAFARSHAAGVGFVARKSPATGE
jgi:SAM-dependent methyltransferase